MAGTNLLALIDDIATLLDDISIMTKVAAKKTAGVLGDDLALNAQQVTGVKADREIPVVWAVAKGSMKNKAILVPAALLISLFAPWAITPLLMLGGAFLCFEGAEKLAHRWLHSAKEIEQEHQKELNALLDPSVDMVAFEEDKIRGAIRTDFILSAEIIVISLGTVADQSLLMRALVLSTIAVLMTVGVYGLVAALVKMDDAGLALFNKGKAKGLRKWAGQALLTLSPLLMKFLAWAGTIAMFLVGGGIIAHGIPPVFHGVEHALHGFGLGATLESLLMTLSTGVIGLVAGFLLVGLYQLKPKKTAAT